MSIKSKLVYWQIQYYRIVAKHTHKYQIFIQNAMFKIMTNPAEYPNVYDLRMILFLEPMHLPIQLQ